MTVIPLVSLRDNGVSAFTPATENKTQPSGSQTTDLFSIFAAVGAKDVLSFTM